MKVDVGKVLLGAASNIRTSPAGGGKLKQQNAFYSRLCCKDPLKLMGVSIQSFILFSRGSYACVYNHYIQKMTIPRRFGYWYFQSTHQLILDVRSSDMALSHQHDLVNY